MGCKSGDSSGSGGGGGSNGNGGGAPSTGSSSGESCNITKGGFQLSSAKASQPAVAWNGKVFGVAYQDLSNDDGDIAFALVDSSGNKKASATIANDSATSSLPTIVATSGGGFLVLWQDDDGTGSKVMGRNVGSSGAVSGGAFSVTSSAAAQSRPNGVAASGGVAIAWADSGHDYLGLISGTSMEKKTTLSAGESAAVGADGSTLGVAWSESSAIGLAILAPPYTSSKSGSISVNGHNPRVVGDTKGGFFVAWEDWRSGEDSPSIYASHVDSSGKAADEVLVESEGTGANYPDLAFSGDHAGVVYYQFRDGPPAIYFTQLKSDLSREGADLEVSSDSSSGSKYARIAWSGSAFGVVYADVDGPVKMSLVGCK
jgi:hypothetical protein